MWTTLILLTVAVDWAKVPQLAYVPVANWPQLPAGWNLGEVPGVALDAQDNVWVFNRGKHPVLQFDKSGKMLRAWEETPLVSAHGIGVDGAGKVWLVDVGGHSVMKFSPEGRLEMVIANSGRTPGTNDTEYAFNKPAGINFRKDGGFYVADGYGNSRVIEFDKNGRYVRHWGKFGKADGEFDLVHDVAVDHARQRLYIGDRNNARIQVFTFDGKHLATWSGFGEPWGLALVEKEQAIYMCDGKNNRVLRLNLEGQVTGVLGQFGKTAGSFDYPHYIAVDSEGSIYVAEIKNWRVQKFVRKK